MRNERDKSIPTRQTLLGRLKRWDDQASWRDFFETYWRLIYAAAIKSGLNDAEAQDVVQETVIAVAKKIETFRYDPAVDSFKGWLLYLTRKRIALQYRRRERDRGGPQLDSETKRTPVEMPDSAGINLDEIWDEEWKRNLWDVAIANAKRQTSPKQFQLFDLYVIKERPALEVARALGVTVAQVYLAKHRISALVKAELDRLKNQLI
ncbi:MAG TPA: sigma-70 family RNA polymerase sigma factor [Verrucomicrobiae bacterium]|nr:sigma-70 family RNA polymerase sigma factor [Verrucomicrobiae bacterium]